MDAMGTKQEPIIDSTWVFPESISFDAVSEYAETFHSISGNRNMVFDLSQTHNIHSSFIGFLIHARHTLRTEGGQLHLHLSYTVERLLVLLNLMEYFSPDIRVVSRRKSA